MVKSFHFGVECGLCSEAFLVPIPDGWKDLEYTAVIQNLFLGAGVDSPELNKAAAAAIVEFFEDHESHGAGPRVCELEDEPD